MALDLATGLACDTALVVRLCRLLRPANGPQQRPSLLRRLSGQNALLAGVQLGLSALKQMLLLAAPLVAG